MKIENYIRQCMILLTLSIILVACNKGQDDPAPETFGEVSFEISQPANQGGRTVSIQSAQSVQAIQSVLVTIEDASSNIVHQNLSITLTDFGDSYISDPIALPTGNYTLTAFAVEDDTQGIILATPAEGSALAHLVSDPVPISFSISKDQVTQVIPEVISTAGFTPGDFGYLDFKFTEVPFFSFLLGVLVYDPTIQDYVMTDATLDVSGDTTPLLSRSLGDSTNVVAIQDGYTNYELSINKQGYNQVDTVLTDIQLQSYTSLPLVIVLESGTSSPPPSSGTFVDSGQGLGNFNSRKLSLGDIDGDGDSDAFVVNSGQSNKVWFNDGSGTFTVSSQDFELSNSSGISLGDLDLDGDLDAFIANFGQPKVWVNDGNGNFIDSGQSLGSSNGFDVSIGDLDGDSDLDAFVVNYNTSQLTQPNKIWLNNGSGNFTDSGQNVGIYDSRSLSLGDIDSDGDLDAFIVNYSGQLIQPNKVWINDGAANFTDSGQSLGNSLGIKLGDLDGDGDLDAFVANVGSNKVWLNDGIGVFTDSGQNVGNSDSRSLSLGDVDGDGDLDAFVANHSSSNKVWINNGSGNFVDSGQNLGNSNSYWVVLDDLNGDGILDAFVANYNQPNTVWFGQP